MLVRNLYKIYNFYPAKTLPAENNSPNNNLPQIDKISNIYYQPIFTSREKEISDTEYQTRLERLINKFGKENLDNIVISDFITKDNIDFAEEFYGVEDCPVKEYLYFVKGVNNENKDFLRKVYRNRNKIPQIRLETYYLVFPYVNKKNQRLAEKLCNGAHNRNFAWHILQDAPENTLPLIEALFDSKDFSYHVIQAVPEKLKNDKSGITVFAEICALLMQDDFSGKDFPAYLLSAFPNKISPSNVKIMKKVYEEAKEQYTAEYIFDNLDKYNINFLKAIWNDKNFYNERLYELLEYVGKSNGEFALDAYKRKKSNPDTVEWLIKITSQYPGTTPYFQELIKKRNFNCEDYFSLFDNRRINSEEIIFLLENDYIGAKKKLQKQIAHMKAHYTDYADTGAMVNPEKAESCLYPESFINILSNSINHGKAKNGYALLAVLFDNNDLDNFFKIKKRNIEEYAKMTEKLDYTQLTFLKNIFKNNADKNKEPLLLHQKLNLLNLLSIYGRENLSSPVKLLEEFTQSNTVDFYKIKTDIIYKYLKEKGSELSEDEIKKQLNTEAINSPRFFDTLERKFYNQPEQAIFLLTADSGEIDKKVKHQLDIMYKFPEQYLNGEIQNKKTAESRLRTLMYYDNECGARICCTLLDSETLDILFRKREDFICDFIKGLYNLKYDDLIYIKQALNCNSTDNKPLTSKQKIDLFYIINAFKSFHTDYKNLDSMISEGRIDIPKLKLDLFTSVMEIIDNYEPGRYSDEKLQAWNTEYIHLLHKSFNDWYPYEQDVIAEIVSFANEKGEFKDKIFNSVLFGEQNKKNKELFKANGLNFDKWLNTPENLEVRFVSKDKNTEQLQQIAGQLTDDIETLRKTPAKSFIDKQFPHCIKNDKFVIPKNYYSCKNNFEEFICGINKQLERVWKSAEGNINNPDKKLNAKKVLTIKNHIEQRLSDVSAIKTAIGDKPLDITIKMWDRIPQKDLFQGNYSTCCIGMGECNASAMPVYLMNSAFNMIELIDNITGNTIGNALCYFVKTNNGPEFIIDNIEIRNSEKPSEKTGEELRGYIKKYATKVTQAIAGEELPIWLGLAFNDLPVADLPEFEKVCEFLGDISNSDAVYLDAFGGWYYSYDGCDEIELHRL